MKPFLDPRLYVNKTTHKGWGIFTKAKIKKGTIIEACIPAKIRYKDIKKEIAIAASYMFMGNKYCDLGTGFARCINHGTKPNVDVYGSEEGLIVFCTAIDIEANEEICMDYGREGWNKPEKKQIFDPKQKNDYIYVDARLYLDYNDKPISKKVKNIDSFMKKTLNNNLLYNVFAKENIKKNTIVEIAMCGVYNKIKIDEKNTLAKLFFYNESKMILPSGFSTLYAMNKEDFNVDMALIEDNRLKFTTNKDINKNEKLIIKSKTF